MTTPALERAGPQPLDGQKPTSDDLKLWSVTTILSVLDKPALIYWAAGLTADAAVDDIPFVEQMLASRGRDETWKWLRDARFRRRKDSLSDAEFGTGIHALCEEYALTGVKPTPTRETFKTDLDAAQACLDQFDRWLAEFQPDYLATEVTVYNATYGYAGTCDGFAAVDGVRTIIDYKSSKKSRDGQGKPTGLYPEIALQLAGYRWAEVAAVWRARRYESFRRRYYLLSAEEQAHGVPVPTVDGGLGIKITPEACTAFPVRCDEAVFEAFLYVLENARWTFDLSKTVIGEPLVKP